MTTDTWNGGGVNGPDSGVWGSNSGGNFSNGQPAAGDDVVFPASGGDGPYTVDLQYSTPTFATVTIDSGGTLDLGGNSLSASSGVTLDTGGAITGDGTVDADIAGAGTATASGGALEFTGAVDATGTAGTFDIDNAAGSDLKFDAAVGVASSITPTIDFIPTGGSAGDIGAGVGTLDLTGEGASEPTDFNGKVEDFQSGDTILVAGVSAADNAVYSSGTLDVYSDAGDTDLIAAITMSGSYNTGQFSVAYNNGVDTITTSEGETDTWTGGGVNGPDSGVWGSASGFGANFSSGLPTADENVILPASGGDGAYTVTLAYSPPSFDSVTVDSGGTLDVGAQTILATGGPGGTDNFTVASGGAVDLAGGTIAALDDDVIAGTLSGYGDVIAEGLGIMVTGTVDATGGTLRFEDAVDPTGTFNIANGSTLAFDGAVDSGATVAFAPGTSGSGILDLTGESGGNDFNATVTNFVVGDEIKVTSGLNESVSGSDVIISDGGTDYTIDLGSPAAASDAQYDSGTGIITTTICFMPGTRIRTPDGDVAVETLKRGDLVATADGRVAPVAWIGLQTITRRLADPLHSLPIRIKAGAIDENVPCRDLRLSPDHAVLIEGALVNAGAMVNGTSVVRERDVPEVFVYYHVETDDHSLVLAENTPAETFLDDVDRKHFDNWAEHEALYPDGKDMAALPYPRARSHRQVPVDTRVKLAKRALAIDVGIAATT